MVGGGSISGDSGSGYDDGDDSDTDGSSGAEEFKTDDGSGLADKDVRSCDRVYMMELLTVTIGYFVMDLWRGRFTLREDSANTLHHVAGVVLCGSLFSMPLAKEQLIAYFLCVPSIRRSVA